MNQTLVALLTACVLDALLPELPNAFHPVAWMGKWIGFSSQLCLRIPAERRGARFLGGVFIILCGLLLFGLPLWVVSGFILKIPWIPGGILLGLLLKPVFTLRGLLSAAQEIYAALARADLTEARRLTAWHLVSRDTSTLSENQIASAAIESVAENLTDSVITPLAAFLIGGLPLAWGFRLINTADAMIGYHSEKWEMIGKFAARLDDVMNWLPARVSGLLIILAAALSGTSWREAFSVMTGQNRRFESPNAGWTIGPVAGALGIRLEKVGAYHVNETGVAPGAEQIRQSCRLVRAAAYLGMGLMVLLCLCKR